MTDPSGTIPQDTTGQPPANPLPADQPPAALIASSITRCADCGCDLHGLAPAGSCPDCGREYHADYIVLRGWSGGMTPWILSSRGMRLPAAIVFWLLWPCVAYIVRDAIPQLMLIAPLAILGGVLVARNFIAWRNPPLRVWFGPAGLLQQPTRGFAPWLWAEKTAFVCCGLPLVAGILLNAPDATRMKLIIAIIAAIVFFGSDYAGLWRSSPQPSPETDLPPELRRRRSQWRNVARVTFSRDSARMWNLLILATTAPMQPVHIQLRLSDDQADELRTRLKRWARNATFYD